MLKLTMILPAPGVDQWRGELSVALHVKAAEPFFDVVGGALELVGERARYAPSEGAESVSAGMSLHAMKTRPVFAPSRSPSFGVRTTAATTRAAEVAAAEESTLTSGA